MLTKAVLHELGVNVDGALARVKALDEDHHARTKATDAKAKHTPLPDAKMNRVVTEEIEASGIKAMQVMTDSLAKLLKESIEAKA